MKKIKAISIITVVLMFALLLTGCGAGGEFETYVSETCIDFDKDYKELHTLYGKVAGMNSPAEMIKTLEDELIPESEKFVKKVKETELSHEENQKLHNIYIEVVELRHEAYENALKGLKENDTKYIQDANICISEADVKLQEFIEERDKLAEELGVELVKD